MVPTVHIEIVWTDYIKYRAQLRSFDLDEMARIIRFSSERYIDDCTRRTVVVGKHKDELVVIPYDVNGNALIPITIHAISRQQIKFRIQTGRFRHV